MVWKPHVTVAAVIERGGKFLMVEERVDGQTAINQPAGHLESGESLLQAVVRETLEETGRHFTPQGLVGIYRWQNPGGQTFLRFAFCGRVTHAEPEAPLDDGIIRAGWMDPEEIHRARSRHRSPLVQRCIDDFRNGVRAPLDLLVDAI